MNQIPINIEQILKNKVTIFYLKLPNFQNLIVFFNTKEISIGNYVLSGGELAASIFVDSIVRLIPGVLSNSNLC